MMATVLVIPAGDTPQSLSWIVRDDENGVPQTWTWEQVAADNGCGRCEALGGQWCTERGVDGLGIRDDLPVPDPTPEPDPVPVVDPVQTKLDSLEDKLNAILAKLGG